MCSRTLLRSAAAAAAAAAALASAATAQAADDVQAQVLQELAARGHVDAIVTFRQEQALSRAQDEAPTGADRVRAILQDLRPALAAEKRSALGAGARVLRDYENLPASVVRFESREALAEMASRPGVTGIAADKERTPTLAESLPLVRQPHVAAAGFTGAGTEVAVIDSGVDLAAFGCAAPGGGCPIVATEDFAPEDPVDNVDHGTNVAGIVHGTASGTRIVALDVFGGGGAWDSDILDAIDRVVELREAGREIRAVNLSLGTAESRYTSTCDKVDGETNRYTEPFRTLRTLGVLPVVAAGNDAYDGDTFKPGISDPACTPRAVSVGAVYDYDGTYSSRGCPEVDTAVPDRVACYSQSAAILTLLAPGTWITAGGLTFSGTSMAAPHVAGAAAILWQARETATAEQVQAALAGTGPSIVDRRSGATKRRLQLCAALTTLLGRPVCATARRSGSDLVLSAGAGQANDVRVSLAAGTFTITDTRAPIDPQEGCQRVTESQVACSASGLTRLSISLRDGNDKVIVTAPTRSFISGGPGDDVLHGGPASDHLVGDDSVSAGRDALNGNGGDDVLEGGLRADVISGGTGEDEARYEFDDRSRGVTVTIDDVANDGDVAESDNVRGNVEAVRGTNHDDHLTGSLAGLNTLWGGNGRDTLRGGNNADRLFGEGGDDELVGFFADDLLDGGHDDDRLMGGPERDHLRGGYGRDHLDGQTGTDRLDGGPGNDPLESLSDAGDVLIGGAGPSNDEADYSTHWTAVNVSLDGLANDGARSEGDNVGLDIEEIRGSRFGDALYGNAAANLIAGGAGGDWLDGGSGNDVLRGEADNDFLVARDGVRDTDVDCGAGSADSALADPVDSVTHCEDTDTR